jgi:heterodisulfide reductase subunit B
MKEFAVFWGCTIPARFPFIEKSCRIVFDDLGAEIHELEGHTCCPEGVLVKANDEETYYTVAARNLALVEKAHLGVVTPCNGCYSTFKETSSHLTKDWRHRDAINEKLGTQDLHYGADVQITHFAEWLADDIGAGVIASKVVKPFWGMRLAVHYGCHLLRPQPAVRWDDPLEPVKVEQLVAALGGRVVDYTTKMQCCGGALDRVGERDTALAFCRRKLVDLQSEDVDALVVVCPSCFQQFDLNQAALRRQNEDLDVPVLYLSELIALAYGHAPEELGLEMHRVPVQPFLDKWDARLEDRKKVAEFFDVAELGKCAACGACKDDCPVCKVDPAFQPTEIIEMLADGKLDEVLEDGQLWKCLECYTCTELCHSRFGMAETFRKLKELATARGSGVDQVSEAYAVFLKTGSLGEPRESARKKLGMDPLPARGADAVNEMLTCEQKKQEVCDADV